jgi:hypothetical protein
MRCDEGRYSQELEPGIARSGEPASDFPNDLPMPNQPRVITTVTLAGIDLFADICGYGDVCG